MHLGNIKAANNGFILEDVYGHLYVAKTLLEAAQIAGEAVPSDHATTYSTGFDSNDLNNIKHHFREGRKIEAIKILRNCFTPRLGLREAKELIENFCS
jgi:ribosomal protein L7/L12